FILLVHVHPIGTARRYPFGSCRIRAREASIADSESFTELGATLSAMHRVIRGRSSWVGIIVVLAVFRCRTRHSHLSSVLKHSARTKCQPCSCILILNVTTSNELDKYTAMPYICA